MGGAAGSVRKNLPAGGDGPGAPREKGEMRAAALKMVTCPQHTFAIPCKVVSALEPTGTLKRHRHCLTDTQAPRSLKHTVALSTWPPSAGARAWAEQGPCAGSHAYLLETPAACPRLRCSPPSPTLKPGPKGPSGGSLLQGHEVAHGCLLHGRSTFLPGGGVLLRLPLSTWLPSCLQLRVSSREALTTPAPSHHKQQAARPFLWAPICPGK